MRQEDCHYNSDLQQEDTKYESDFEQQDCQYISDEQQEDCEYFSNSEQSSSELLDIFMDRDVHHSYDQFPNHVEYAFPTLENDQKNLQPIVYHGDIDVLNAAEMFSVQKIKEQIQNDTVVPVYDKTNGCIDDFIFFTQDVLQPIVQLPSDYFYEEEIVIFDNQELITRGQESHLFSNKGKSIYRQSFFLNQQASDHGFDDPVAAYMESYVSNLMKISDFSNSPVLRSECDSRKKFLSMLSFFYYFLLSSLLDEIISVIKMLEWLLWKSTFT